MARKKKTELNELRKKRLELMGYGRKIKYLKRCICVSKLLEQYEDNTSVRCRVFEKYIEPVIGVSLVTFYNMIREINPELQIIEINKKITLLKNPPVQKVDETHSIPQRVKIIDRVVPVDGGW